MKKTPAAFMSALLLCLFLLSAGCTRNPPGVSTSLPGTNDSLQQANYTSNETLVAFVESAVVYARTHGRERALKEFNNRNGSFIRGELYIYAYAFNGTTLAHPINPESVGKPREGANGIFVREMGAGVRNGSGFYRFTYINPLHNGTLESKLGYGAQVDEDWWLGSGVYTGPVQSSTPQPSAP